MRGLASFQLSDVGRKRGNNEDYAGFFEPQDARTYRESGALYVVADGLGGHEFGERASQYAVKTLLREYYQAPPSVPPGTRLRTIIEKINRDLFQQAQQMLGPGQKMATTIVAAVVREGTLQVAHVGDSRAYLIREGKPYQLTQDHSIVGEMVRAGAITEEQARQSKYRNRLSRSVGGAPEVKVDVSQPIPLYPGDWLVLCTDGLTQYVTGHEIATACAQNTPEAVARRLVNLANERGGADNVTVSVLRYEGKAAPQPAQKMIQRLALGGIGGLLLLALAFFAWAWSGDLPLPFLVTPTFTASPTFTSSPTLTATATFTFTPPPSETPTPEATFTATATPAPSLTPTPELTDCFYKVRQGDTTFKIAQRFGIPSSQVFRKDGSQTNMNSIRAGEILILRGVSLAICVAQGGFLPTATPTLPPTKTPTPAPTATSTAAPTASPTPAIPTKTP